MLVVEVVQDPVEVTGAVKADEGRHRVGAVSLTKKTRYSGAAISPDGVRIVIINNLENGLFQMSIVSSNMGILLKELVAPSATFYSMPNWSRDGIHISVVKHGQDGVAVVRIHSETGAEETLIDFTRENIGYPVLDANRLFYKPKPTPSAAK